MIGISRLYLGESELSDHLRYIGGGGAPFSGRRRRPVVVWNTTARCNLQCMHCYAHATDVCGEHELSGGEARALIDDLAACGCPVLLFSGGEPLLRGDVPELIRYAVDHGLRAVVSTNGTLISADMARRLKASGTSYVGVSLDGLRATNDRFRGRSDAFERALAGIRACRLAGVKVGLRLTLTRHNIGDLPGVFDLIRQESIPRVCFYHLVYTGRGADLRAADLSHAQTRAAVDQIVDFAAADRRRGERREVLTVDNACDGPYLYLRMQRERHPAADQVRDLLRANGGNASGSGIACVSWDGVVYPDQFWRNHPLGNIRARPFSAIWSDDSIEWLARLRARETYLNARCLGCRFIELCRGNCRARAEAALGDPWACDPACYLTDAEIAPTSEEAQ
jgi:radical SAM protein with 4Fe4S-binding SPASM domain